MNAQLPICPHCGNRITKSKEEAVNLEVTKLLDTLKAIQWNKCNRYENIDPKVGTMQRMTKDEYLALLQSREATARARLKELGVEAE